MMCSHFYPFSSQPCSKILESLRIEIEPRDVSDLHALEFRQSYPKVTLSFPQFKSPQSSYPRVKHAP